MTVLSDVEEFDPQCSHGCIIKDTHSTVTPHVLSFVILVKYNKGLIMSKKSYFFRERKQYFYKRVIVVNFSLILFKQSRTVAESGGRDSIRFGKNG